MSDVIIVGAGIVGLSTAYWLVKQGVDVSVVEQGAVPSYTAASMDHHRLIRYPYGKALGYCSRVSHAFSAWRDMWEDLPGTTRRYYNETGVLCVSEDEGDYTDISTQEMDRIGVPYEWIAGDDVVARFPFLLPGNYSYATLSEGGALMARHILLDLADWLRMAGTEILEHTAVSSVDYAGTVRLVDGRRLSADRIVVAAGIETGRLLPDMALPLTPHRSVLVYADPPEELVDLYSDMPCWNALGGDLDVYGMPSMDGLPMKLGNGGMGYRDPAASNRQLSPNEVQRMLSDYAIRFKGAEHFRVRWHQANYWTAAPNSEFQLHQLGRVQAVSACSGHGFKFGALSGKDVSEAVLEVRTLAEVQARMAAQEPAQLDRSDPFILEEEELDLDFLGEL